MGSCCLCSPPLIFSPFLLLPFPFSSSSSLPPLLLLLPLFHTFLIVIPLPLFPTFSSLLSPFLYLSHSTAPPYPTPPYPAPPYPAPPYPAPPHSSSSFLLNFISPPLLPHA